MKTLLAFLGKTALIGAAGVLAACGSNVSNNGTGGAGGAGGSGGSGAGPTGEQACLDFCHKMETNNCGSLPGDCTTYCGGQFDQVPAECADELGAMYACYLPYVSMCPDDPPPECADEGNAANACAEMYGCAGGDCSGGEGMNGESFCGCASKCLGKEYATDCTSAPGGMTTCKCLVGGAEVGTCTNASAVACGVEESCCNAQYFKIP